MPVYVGDTLTIIRLRLTIGVPIVNPPVLKIKYEKPSGDTGEWNADVYISGGDYHAEVEVANGAIDLSGIWTFQTYAELSSGWKGHGDKYEEWIYSPIAVV